MENINPLALTFVDGVTPLNAETLNPIVAKINELVTKVNDTAIDITSLFSFTDNLAVVVNSPDFQGYATFQTTVFKLSNSVDLSQYIGRKIRFTTCSYKTASGEQPKFGSVFTESKPENNSPIIESYQFPLYDDGSPSTGTSIVVEMAIPDNGAFFTTTYFMDAKAQEFGADTFKCEII